MISIHPDKKREIITKYNASSHFYDKRYSQIQNEKYDIIIQNFVLNYKIILDAGCGTGLLFEFIEYSLKKRIQKIEFFRFVGIDISWNMLKIFSKKIKDMDKIGIKKKINLILSDLENLPFRDGVFSSVIATTALQNLPTVHKGIKELIRVARNLADFNITILKKNIDIGELKMKIIPKLNNLVIENPADIEDVIIQGNVNKV